MELIFFLSLLVLSSVFLIPFLIQKDEVGLFSPMKLLGLFMFVRTAPFLVNFFFDQSIMHSTILTSPGVQPDPLGACAKYCLIHAISFLFTLVSYYVITAKSKFAPRQTGACFESNWFFIAVVIGVGLVALSIKIRMAGGIANTVYFSLKDRVATTAGTGYITTIYEVAFVYGLLLLIKKSRDSDVVWWKSITLIHAGLCFLSFSAYGGRKGLVYSLIISLFCWNRSIAIISRLRFWHFGAALLSLVYLFFMLSLRNSKRAEEEFSFSDLALSASTAVVAPLNEISYAQTYIYITNNFGFRDYWWGASVKDLMIAPIPSALYSNKPPVDDGVYIYNIAKGRDVQPSTPQWEMEIVGWPPETLGLWYANFGMLGAFLGSSLLGAIFGVLKLLLEPSKAQMWSSYLLGFYLMNFHLTVLRVSQCLTLAAVLALFVFLGKFLHLRRAEKEWR